MGYKTELNYILKSNSAEESKEMFEQLNNDKNSLITITKSGHRTFILGAPIMISDHNWKIFGMCIIDQTTTSASKTVLKARVLTRFSDLEAELVSRLIQDAEKLKG